MHNRIQSRVFTTCQLLLANTKVHDRSYLQVFSTRQQSLASSVLLVLHKPNHWVIYKSFQGTKHYSLFCKLRHELYYSLDYQVAKSNFLLNLKRKFDEILVFFFELFSMWMSVCVFVCVNLPPRFLITSSVKCDIDPI